MAPGLYALVGLGALLLICAFHPFVTYPLSLILFAPRQVLNQEEWATRPEVAICLSAFNEEAVIVEKVRTLIAAARRYGPATVHIYTDGCTDRTVELIQPFASEIDLFVSDERRGKTHGMNTLLGRSSSLLVMFADANVVADEMLVEQLAQPFQDPAVGCTTASLQYSNPGESATSLAGSVYWTIEEAVKRIESDTVGVIGVDGASFMMRRALYQRAPDNLIDDLFVTLNVLATGASIVRVADAVVYERSAVQPQEEYNRKVRIASQAINVHRCLWPMIKKLPALTVYAYISHRIMKWLIPFFLVGAAAMFSVALALSFGPPAIIAVVMCTLLIVIGGRRDIAGLSLVYTSCLSLTGVAHGLILGLFSRRSYTTWEPAVSVRSPPSEPA
ncbi:glycosyltransferase [Rhizorhabdus argentea]|uniref:glycosyltransferase n=1 Tax=Rhizorhabdus argentea TaxID=1387174 RepID=UPI0030EC2EDE